MASPFKFEPLLLGAFGENTLRLHQGGESGVLIISKGFGCYENLSWTRLIDGTKWRTLRRVSGACGFDQQHMRRFIPVPRYNALTF